MFLKRLGNGLRKLIFRPMSERGDREQIVLGRWVTHLYESLTRSIQPIATLRLISMFGNDNCSIEKETENNGNTGLPI